MSVLIETSLGDIVIDLYTEDCPRTALNFIKLCKIKYYNFSPFHNVQRNFMAQTGDPTGKGDKSESIYGILEGSSKRYFPAEINNKLTHKKRGTVSMAVAQDASMERGGVSGSQFFITLDDGLDYLDGKYTVFGEVAEGYDTLDKINDAYCDDNGRPLRDIRIRHTIILDDPFPDPAGLEVPDQSPLPTKEQLASMQIAEDENIEEEGDEDEIERRQREREAKAQALTLEMVGDLPFAEVKPPENVLFVCKLNPVTRDEDLELIFSRFGQINSCEIIRDRQTGDSLCYAFIEYENKGDAEEAYFKMQSVLVDDRRIHVDFSQSVSKLHTNWISKRLAAREAAAGGASGGKYDMVFDHQEDIERHQEQKQQEQQEQQERSRDKGRGGGDRYDDRPAQHRDAYRERGHDRRPERNGHRDRDRGRDYRDRDRDYRDRDSDKDRDRERPRERRRTGSRSTSRPRHHRERSPRRDRR